MGVQTEPRSVKCTYIVAGAVPLSPMNPPDAPVSQLEIEYVTSRQHNIEATV